MKSFEKDRAIIHIDTIRDLTWLDYGACTYADELAVFRFSLRDRMSEETYLQTLMQSDELRRAYRYRQLADRQRFIYTRGVLRALLSRYVNERADLIVFSEGVNKKPELPGHRGLDFNVSHSGDWVLIAIGKVNVGVDIEQIKPDFPFEDLLPSTLSPEECTWLDGRTDARSRFYQLWTRKEALVKATGIGMSDNFPKVPSLDGIHDVPGDFIGATATWAVAGFMTDENYPASLAYNSETRSINFYSLDTSFLLSTQIL